MIHLFFPSLSYSHVIQTLNHCSVNPDILKFYIVADCHTNQLNHSLPVLAGVTHRQ